MPANPTDTLTLTTHDANWDVKRTMDAVVDGYCRRTSQVVDRDATIANLRSKLSRLVWAASGVVKAYEDGGMIRPMGDLIDVLRDIDGPADTCPVAVETEAEREVTRLREEVALLTERLESRIKMTDQLHCVCDDYERLIGERDATIERLTSENEQLQAKAIQLLDRVESWQLEASGLRSQLTSLSAREVETARRCEAVVAENKQLWEEQDRLEGMQQRCEAVVKAFEGMRPRDGMAAEWRWRHYVFVGRHSLTALRQAVDALRTATATEAKS